MTVRKLAGIVIPALFIAALSGCAKKTMTALIMLDVVPGTFSSAVVRVGSGVQEDVEEERSYLEEKVARELTALAVFSEVLHGKAEESVGEETLRGTAGKALLVKISITGINKVSSGKRVWLGAFAGNAFIEADVSFMDAASGKIVGRYRVRGESGGTGISGSTVTAADKVALAVAELVSENFK